MLVVLEEEEELIVEIVEGITRAYCERLSDRVGVDCCGGGGGADDDDDVGVSGGGGGVGC